jgi:Flp pilus assembly protein TadG
MRALLMRPGLMRRWTNRFGRRWLRLWHDRKGAMIAEFAASIPMMLILVMSGTEISRFIILQQKLDRATTAVADLISQEEDITTAKVNAVFDAIPSILAPYTFGDKGAFIVTSVVLDNGTLKVAWQRRSAGAFAATSKIGAQGGTATLPAGLVIRTNETIVISESFYRFEPMFAPSNFTSWLDAETTYHQAFYRPRFGALTTID